MPQLSRALASEPLLAAPLLGPLCAVISGHRTTRLHHEIPALRKPSSSSSRNSPLTASYQPLVYSRIVGNPYLGIISGLHSGRMLSLTRERSRIRQDYGLGRRQQVSAIRLLSERSDPRVNQRLTSSGSSRRFSYVLFVL